MSLWDALGLESILSLVDFSVFYQVKKVTPLTLKIGVGDSPTKHFRSLTMPSGTKLWLSNLHAIIIFGVCNKWKTKILGVR